MKKTRLRVVRIIFLIMLFLSIIGINTSQIEYYNNSSSIINNMAIAGKQIALKKQSKEEENKIISSRGKIDRKQPVIYVLYELSINNKDKIYYTDMNIAENKKKYILNNTNNIRVTVSKVELENNNCITSNADAEAIINYYINKYPKIYTCFPTKSHKVSSTYGKRSRGDFHTGIDLSGNYGDNIYAYKSGKIIKIQHSNVSYGNMVLIQHNDGMQTRYAHMSSINVKNGQSVSYGQIIGHVGSTGNSTGNHLHFEIIINGKTVNPYNYIF